MALRGAQRSRAFSSAGQVIFNQKESKKQEVLLNPEEYEKRCPVKVWSNL